MKHIYEVPVISVMDFAVEQGFATSLENKGENGNWVGLQSADSAYDEYL